MGIHMACLFQSDADAKRQGWCMCVLCVCGGGYVCVYVQNLEYYPRFLI